MAKKKVARREPREVAAVSRVPDKLQAVHRRRRTPATHRVPMDEQGFDRLFQQARRLSSDMAQRVRGATKDVEPRIERLFSTLEKEAEARFEQLFVRWIWRLGLVAQRDVRGLSQRIDRLERQLRIRQSPRLKAVARKPPAKAASESDSPATNDNSAA